MTPEQEILEDALVATRLRIASFREELAEHAQAFPLPDFDTWDAAPVGIRTHIAAFSKRFEMTQDHVVRKMFRSIIAISGQVVRMKSLGDVIDASADLGVISDATTWHRITAVRNILAHDYMIRPASFIPVINEAWSYAPLLIEGGERGDVFVLTNNLLGSDLD